MDKRKEFEALRRQRTEQLPKHCCNCDSTDDLHIHHIVPLALGGTNRISNLAVICSTCHRKSHGIYREYNHKELVMAGKKTAKDNGRWSAGRMLYGYVSGNKKGEVLVSADEAEVVRMIYRWKYVYQLRLVEICEILTMMAINTRRESTKWEISTVNQILSRPNIYLGCKHKNVDFPRILDSEFQAIIDNFSDPHKRKKRSYAGKTLKVDNRITIGKASDNHSGAFSIA